jgi:hypothetical protein
MARNHLKWLQIEILIGVMKCDQIITNDLQPAGTDRHVIYVQVVMVIPLVLVSIELGRVAISAPPSDLAVSRSGLQLLSKCDYLIWSYFVIPVFSHGY